MKSTTKNDVLNAYRCTAMYKSYGSDELDRVFIVPKEYDYDGEIPCYFCDSHKWGTWSASSYGSYFDSDLMLAQMEFFDKEQAVKILEQLGAFD